MRITLILLGLLLGLAPLTAVPAAEQTPSPERVELARQFILKWVQQDYPGATAYLKSPSSNQHLLQNHMAPILMQLASFQQMGAIETFFEKSRNMLAYLATCQFERGWAKLGAAFNDDNKIVRIYDGTLKFSVPYRPPAYVNTQAMTDREVTLEQKEQVLLGMLTRPVEKTNIPGIVLVHEIGLGDRDGSFGPNKLFRDLAWGLASQGIAVLRYEKRVVVQGRQLPSPQYTVDDALKALAFLRNVPQVDPKRVFLLGHGFGGLLAPRIGARDPHLAGLIIFAGATQPAEDVLLAQMISLAQADGTITREEQQQIDEAKRCAARVKDPQLLPDTPAQQLMNYPASFWLDLRGYQPDTAAKNLSCPFLILQGERDFQVTVKDDFARWQQALAGRNNVVMKRYPALNHHFIAGTKLNSPAEYWQVGHVDAQVVTDIAQWVNGIPPSSGK